MNTVSRLDYSPDTLKERRESVNIFPLSHIVPPVFPRGGKRAGFKFTNE